MTANTRARGHPSGARTFLVLSRAARAMESRALASIEDTGLCASDFAVLEALLHKGPLPVNTLGKTVLLTSGSITTSVDRLADRTLVARSDDPNDRRVRIVSLTPEGRRLIKPAYARHAGDLEKIAAGLTGAERTTLVSLLLKLARRADENGAGLEAAS